MVVILAAAAIASGSIAFYLMLPHGWPIAFLAAPLAASAAVLALAAVLVVLRRGSGQPESLAETVQHVLNRFNNR